MTERLIPKLDRLGAEAGIKEMTPEIYRFAQLLNDEKMKQWDEWKAKQDKRVWTFWDLSGNDIVDAIKTKLKEKNT